jgi:hypothetical protein
MLVAEQPSAASGTPVENDWVALSKEAGAAKNAGRLGEASALYERALRASPRNLPLLRASCQVELALERGGASKSTSRNACFNAFLQGDSPEDMRNEVASLLSPPRRPTLDELVHSVSTAEAAAKKGRDQPWGYLARCDIARRLGSADVMEACLSDLQHRQPLVQTPEWLAQRSTALALAGGPHSLGWRIFIGVFLLVVVGTLAHALFHRRRREAYAHQASKAIVAAIFVILCVVSGGVAQAATPGEDLPGAAAMSSQPEAPTPAESAPNGRRRRRNLSDFQIDDADPVSSVPDAETLAKAPLQYGYLLQDLAAKAEASIKKGDHLAAARFFAALSKAAPGVAYVPRKMCEQLEAGGDLAKALMACRTAITMKGSTLNDYDRFVRLALNQRRELSAAERKELDAVVAHVAADPAAGPVASMLRCEVALKFEDTKALESCTAELAKLAPKDPRTITFEWALAVQKKQKTEALQLIEKARGAGMSAASVASMERATHEMVKRRIGRIAVIVLGAAFLGFVLALALRRLGSRRRVSV